MAKPNIKLGTLLQFAPSTKVTQEYAEDLLIYLGGDSNRLENEYFHVYSITHAKFFHFPDYDFDNWFLVYDE